MPCPKRVGVTRFSVSSTSNEDGACYRTCSCSYCHFHWNPWTSPEENRDRAAAQLARQRPDLFNWAVSEDGHNHPHDFEAPDWKEDSEYL